MNNLITLVAIQSFYEKENNFQRVLAFFILQCWKEKEDKALSLTEIKQQLQELFQISAPLMVIERALKILIEEEKIIRFEEDYCLTDKGTEQCLNIKYTIQAVEKESKELIHALYNFSLQFVLVPHPNEEEMEKSLISFIRKNTIDTINILYDENLTNEQGVLDNSKLEVVIIKFLQQLTEQHTQTLGKMVNGAILKEAIQKENLTKIELSCPECDLFLDTNVLLGLFGFDFPLFNKQISECVSLATEQCKFKLKIFDFTKREIFALLEKYRDEFPRLIANVQVGNIYYKMKYQGWKTQDVERFLTMFDQRLSERGIELVKTKDWKLQPTEEQISQMTRYKSEESSKVCQHDIQAVNAINYIRQEEKYSLQESKALFLTSDYRLFLYAKDFLHPREYPLVLTNSILENILWYSLPSFRGSNLPLSSIIAGNESKLLIKENIFYEFISLLRKKGLNEQEIAHVIVQNETNILLRNSSLEDIKNETDNFKREMERAIKESKEAMSQKEEKIAELSSSLYQTNTTLIATQDSLSKEKQLNCNINQQYNHLQEKYFKETASAFNVWFKNTISFIAILVVAIIGTLYYKNITNLYITIGCLFTIFMVFLCLSTNWGLPDVIKSYLPKTKWSIKEKLFEMYKRTRKIDCAWENIEKYLNY